uniref:Uncharacterized protein n=1 Tax=Romanomermis culicivorax TaxID=13658 RepID=A0A915KPX8_ROMCU
MLTINCSNLNDSDAPEKMQNMRCAPNKVSHHSFLLESNILKNNKHRKTSAMPKHELKAEKFVDRKQRAERFKLLVIGSVPPKKAREYRCGGQPWVDCIERRRCLISGLAVFNVIQGSNANCERQLNIISAGDNISGAGRSARYRANSSVMPIGKASTAACQLIGTGRAARATGKASWDNVIPCS